MMNFAVIPPAVAANHPEFKSIGDLLALVMNPELHAKRLSELAEQTAAHDARKAEADAAAKTAADTIEDAKREAATTRERAAFEMKAARDRLDADLAAAAAQGKALTERSAKLDERGAALAAREAELTRREVAIRDAVGRISSAA